MIRSESSEAEALDYAERILEQTRNITHLGDGVLEVCRGAAGTWNESPMREWPYQTVVERVVSEVGGGPAAGEDSM